MCVVCVCVCVREVAWVRTESEVTSSLMCCRFTTKHCSRHRMDDGALMPRSSSRRSRAFTPVRRMMLCLDASARHRLSRAA